MKSAKERTIERKRARREMNAKKTERSRARRIANGKKRDEIHAVDPDFKVVIMNQRTYDEYGTEVIIDNGKIVAKELDNDIIEATIEFCKQPAERAVFCRKCGGDKLLQTVYCQKCQDLINEEAEKNKTIDTQAEKEKKSIFNKLAGWRKK